MTLKAQLEMNELMKVASAWLLATLSLSSSSSCDWVDESFFDWIIKSPSCLWERDYSPQWVTPASPNLAPSLHSHLHLTCILFECAPAPSVDRYNPSAILLFCCLLPFLIQVLPFTLGLLPYAPSRAHSSRSSIELLDLFCFTSFWSLIITSLICEEDRQTIYRLLLPSDFQWSDSFKSLSLPDYAATRGRCCLSIPS